VVLQQWFSSLGQSQIEHPAGTKPKGVKTRISQVSNKIGIPTLRFYFCLQEKEGFPCIRLKTSDRQVSNNISFLCDYANHQRRLDHANVRYRGQVNCDLVRKD